MSAPIILPPALQPFAAENRWVVWKLVKNRKGKLTKPPYRADAPHQHAKCDDPSTWCDLPTAMQAYSQDLWDGIGFALMGSDYGAPTSTTAATPRRAISSLGRKTRLSARKAMPK